MATFQRDIYNTTAGTVGFSGAGNRVVTFTGMANAIGTLDTTGSLVSPFGAGSLLRVGDRLGVVATVDSTSQVTLAHDWAGSTPPGQAYQLYTGVVSEAVMAGIYQTAGLKGTAGVPFQELVWDDGAKRMRFIVESGQIRCYAGLTRPSGAAETAVNLAYSIDPATGAMSLAGLALSGAVNWAAAVNVASAATADIWAAASNVVNITGTTTISSFGTISAGAMRWVRFAGVLTLTHNAVSLILPGGANITTEAGACALVESLGGGNAKVQYYAPSTLAGFRSRLGYPVATTVGGFARFGDTAGGLGQSQMSEDASGRVFINVPASAGSQMLNVGGQAQFGSAAGPGVRFQAIGGRYWLSGINHNNNGLNDVVISGDGANPNFIVDTGGRVTLSGAMRLPANGSIACADNVSGISVMGGSGYPNGGGLVLRGSNGGAGGTANQGIEFYAGGSERARLGMSGTFRVGVAPASEQGIFCVNTTGAGAPATSGAIDANIVFRWQGASVVVDHGMNSSGQAWIQPRLQSDFSSNFGLTLCPNGQNVGIGPYASAPPAKLSVIGNVQLDHANPRMRLNNSAGTATTLIFGADSSTTFLGAETNATLNFVTNGVTRWLIEQAGVLRPGADNTYTFGNASFRPSQLFAATTTINTSDTREKLLGSSAITIDHNAYLLAAHDTPEVWFQWLEAIARKGEEGARWHFGPTAQGFRDACLARGVDPVRIAAFCEDEIVEMVTRTRTAKRQAFKMVTVERAEIVVIDGVPTQKTMQVEEKRP
ncbi:MAG: hypothetical protein ACRCVA_13420, partial [Phreatobacter sp.]